MNLAFRSSLKKLSDCICSEMAESFLECLLNLMKEAFIVDSNYRRNIEGFQGRYLFKSVDKTITVSAIFDDGTLHVREALIPDPHVTIVFKDGRALKNLLLSGNPDIIGSMLRQEVSPEGNLSYIYKLAYLARRLQLMAEGRLLVKNIHGANFSLPPT